MSVLFIALSLLTIDQLSKFIILKNLQPGESLPVIKNIFHISLVLNKGIAFGIFSETTGLIFIWIAIVCVIIIVFVFAKMRRILCGIEKYKCDTTAKIAKSCQRRRFSCKRESTQIFLSLILAGAIGNLIDRIRFGYVVDFLDFRIWPVFNIADSAITIGALLLALQMLRPKTEY